MLHLGDFSGTKLLHAVRNANPFLLILTVLAIYGCLRDSFAAVEGFFSKSGRRRISQRFTV